MGGAESRMDWKPLLAYITGSVNQELLLRNEYLVAENHVLRNQITERVRLSDGERKTLAEIGKKLGKKALEEVATLVKPDTILAWHRKLIAKKFDGSQKRKSLGRPQVDEDLEALVRAPGPGKPLWGYDRMAGALKASGLHDQRPNGRQHLEASQHPAGSRAQEDHHLERVHPHAHGDAGGDGLFHDRGVDGCWAGDV